MDALLGAEGAAGVVGVLDFHLGVVGHVDGLLPGLGLGIGPLLDAHVQFEGGVRLLLAVQHAGLLAGRLSSEHLSVHTVGMALSEQKLGKRVLSVGVLLEDGVSTPV